MPCWIVTIGKGVRLLWSTRKLKPFAIKNCLWKKILLSVDKIKISFAKLQLILNFLVTLCCVHLLSTVCDKQNKSNSLLSLDVKIDRSI